MKTMLVILVIIASISFSACKSQPVSSNAKTTESVESESQSQISTEEPETNLKPETISNESEIEEQTVDEKNSEEHEVPEETTSEEDSPEEAASIEEVSSEEETEEEESISAIETTAELDLEAAFRFAGITVEKIDGGYLLTYPASILSEISIEDLRESLDGSDIITDNDDGSATFWLTDEDFSYMAESFRKSRTAATE